MFILFCFFPLLHCQVTSATYRIFYGYHSDPVQPKEKQVLFLKLQSIFIFHYLRIQMYLFPLYFLIIPAFHGTYPFLYLFYLSGIVPSNVLALSFSFHFPAHYFLVIIQKCCSSEFLFHCYSVHS